MHEAALIQQPVVHRRLSLLSHCFKPPLIARLLLARVRGQSGDATTDVRPSVVASGQAHGVSKQFVNTNGYGLHLFLLVSSLMPPWPKRMTSSPLPKPDAC